jgi:hypothetical protein
MKALLLVAVSVLAGCAAMPAAVPSADDTASRAAALQSGRTSRTTSGTRTQTVGLPLSRAGKIGLWTGVAVVLAYLMATDGEDDGTASPEP